MADAADSKSATCECVRVRVPPSAVRNKSLELIGSKDFFIVLLYLPLYSIIEFAN